MPRRNREFNTHDKGEGGKTRLLAKAVKDGASPDELRKLAADLNLAPCVQQEWANEPRRREVMERLRKEKAARSGGAPRRTVGQPYRRVILRVLKEGRETFYHATKGWRSFRRPAEQA